MTYYAPHKIVRSMERNSCAIYAARMRQICAQLVRSLPKS